MVTMQVKVSKEMQSSKQICLGNGLRISFKSKREMGYFLADVNRFLTKCLAIINQSMCNAYIQYRAIWFVSVNNKTGTKTNYFKMEQKIKDNFLLADQILTNVIHGHNNTDSFFSFIDIRKVCMYLHDACSLMEKFNEDRNLTAAKYECVILKERFLLIIERMQNYGYDKKQSDNYVK